MFYEQVNGVYVDGRKDATLTTAYLESGKIYQSTCLEEHIVMVKEPGEYYLSHFSTEDGKGSSTADGIFSVIKGTDLEVNLAVIGTDGAATMTSINKGCIRKLEEALQRPLQWVICLLHTNELPLRHIFVELDGSTKSPDAFAGPIGKKLDGNVSQWPVVAFKPIPNPHFPSLPDDVLEDLSTDQYYGYKICLSVICGEVSNDLRFHDIGPIVQSWWLTLACRILRLYIATENPSENLTILALFSIKVYFQTWFEIKHYSKLTCGSKNFFNLFQRIISFPNQKVGEIGLKVLQNNGFFAHPENILLGMLGDDDEDLRRMAVNKLCCLRSKGRGDPIDDNFEREFIDPSSVPTTCTAVRKFLIPKINFKAKSFLEMVNLNVSDIFEPPAIKQFSYEEINKLRLRPLKLSHPCHNQAVERHVKLVTEASASTTGHERRDGMIRQRIQSRRLMKSFETKKQFTV